MAKAQKSAKGKGVKKAAKKTRSATVIRPEKHLGFFLIELAIDNATRARFDADPEATLDELEDKLSAVARKAVLAHDGATLAERMKINNQAHFLKK